MFNQIKAAWMSGKRELAWLLYQNDVSGHVTDKAAFFAEMQRSFGA